jgi:hypothetical protein
VSEPDAPCDRQQLYDEVWTDPVTVVAERYGLSDVGLAKICRKLSIPVPTRGYWAKVKAGKKMRRIALPALQQAPEALLPRATLAKLSPEKREVRSVARKKAAEVRAFLGKLVPFVILLILDNPNTLWRDACYPVVEP